MHKSTCFRETNGMLVVAGVIIALLAGCSKSDETLQEHFVRTQEDIETPDGEILPETVTSDGEYLQYRTDGGGHWRIKATEESGNYRYSDAQRLPTVDSSVAPDS